MRYGFVIDQRKCIGCHACTVACKEENQVALGVNRTWVKYIEKGTFPDTRRYFSVMRCNHCDNAPCVAICPTVALYRRSDGIVDFDGDRCIGCKSCMQACPYYAHYTDPETQTAAKCHYCAHRVEVGLEPACVIVCPVQAIVPGDLDDPGSTIARLIASQQTSVRKPEQGTQPKLFYLGAEEAALTPTMQERGPSYLFSEGSGIPVPGRPNVARAAVPVGNEGVDLLRLARTVYDVAHPERPWGWKVSTYLWTKSIAAGALLVAALATMGGLSAAGPLASLVAPVLSLLFLAVTTALLVLDLKRPERFLYLLFKPNWRSWLVWGGYILMAHGFLAVLWLLAGLRRDLDALVLLAAPVALVMLASAGYSAMLLLAAGFLLGDVRAVHGLSGALWLLLVASALVIFAETLTAHASHDAARAARLLVRGAYSGRFWGGVVGAGTIVPILLLTGPFFPGSSILAALLALAGLWLWEDLWVRAGQALPLS